jgi:hypothetical protein
MHTNESGHSGTATLDAYRESADESLAALSELGAFYPLISYPAPADDLEEEEETLDPLIMAGLIGPQFYDCPGSHL